MDKDIEDLIAIRQVRFSPASATRMLCVPEDFATASLMGSSVHSDMPAAGTQDAAATVLDEHDGEVEIRV
jgi:hypothetical protein